MKGTDINPNATPDAVIPAIVSPTAVIPADAGIQPNQASGFRVTPGITTLENAILGSNHVPDALMMDGLGFSMPL